MQKETRVDWVGTTEIINRTRQHMPVTKPNRREKIFTWYLVPFTTRVQANARWKCGQSPLWKSPFNNLNKYSSERISDIRIKRTMDCTRPDLAKCEERWTCGKYLNRTGFHVLAVCVPFHSGGLNKRNIQIFYRSISLQRQRKRWNWRTTAQKNTLIQSWLTLNMNTRWLCQLFRANKNNL